jgi:hypothetical protein
MQFHFDKIEDFVGFSISNAKAGESVKILYRAIMTSDNPDFYRYIDELSKIYLNRFKVLTDQVYRFLVIIHDDLSADVYVNDFPVSIEIIAKRAFEKGSLLMKSDIANIRKLRFDGIEFLETDKVICCFKVGWRFGLYFDLAPRKDVTDQRGLVKGEKFNVEEMMLSLGSLYRYLLFYNIYKVFESESVFEEMLKDGWFPFIDTIGKEYEELIRIYQSRFSIEERIRELVNKFDKNRIEKITDKWWDSEIFASKKTLIQAGISAYLQDSIEGNINCIKNLCTEIEGVLREVYGKETGRRNNVFSKDFIPHIIAKGLEKSAHDYSLFFPKPFWEYLEKVFFVKFDIETGKVDLSRHTASHGVAREDQYTKPRALQVILILDQICFYIGKTASDK